MASGINFTPDGVPELTRALETLDKLVTSVGKLAGTGKALEELRRIIVGVGDSGSALHVLSRSVQDLAGIVRSLPVELKTALSGLKVVGSDAGKALGDGLTQGANESLKKAKTETIAGVEAIKKAVENAQRSATGTYSTLGPRPASVSPIIAKEVEAMNKEAAALESAVAKVMKAATLPGGVKSAEESASVFYAAQDAQKAAVAKWEAQLAKEAKQLEASVSKVIKAIERPGYTHAGPTWWEKALAEQEAAQIKLSAKNAELVAKIYANNTSGPIMSGTYSDIRSQQRVTPTPEGVPESTLNGLKKFTQHANEAHSAARGLASGLGLLWLTWGSMVPLLAGAAISNATVQMIKMGAEVEHTMRLIGSLGDVGAEGVKDLNKELLKVASGGVYGPLQVAEALKAMSMAGLDAKQQIAALGSTLQFAQLGEMPTKQAAETLAAIAQAFGYSARDWSVVGDIISQTAASTTATISDMAAAFKSSSVVAQLYGVALQDTAVSLGLLNQIGIRGTAGGTAMRQMFTELIGVTTKGKKALEELGIQVMTTDKQAMLPFRDIIVNLTKALSGMNGLGQMRALQDLMNERGLKAAVAGIQGYIAEQKNLGLSSEETVLSLGKLAQQIEDAPGTMAVAAAAMATTSKNLMTGVKTALESSLVETFDALQPVLVRVALTLRKTFQSEGFKDALATLADYVSRFTTFIIDHASAIVTLMKLYVDYRVALVALVVVTKGLLVWQAVTTAWAAATGALGTLSAVVRAATISLTGFNAALTTTEILTGAILIALAAAAAHWWFFSKESKKANDERVASLAATTAISLGEMEKEYNRLGLLIAKMWEGTDSQTAQAQIKSDLVVAEIAERYKILKLTQLQIALSGQEQLAKMKAAGQQGSAVTGVELQVSGALKALENLGMQETLEISRARQIINGLKERAKEYERLASAEARLRLKKPQGNEDYAGPGKPPKSSDVPSQNLDLLAVEKAYYAQNMSELQRASTQEKAILDAKHKALLISEGQYQAQSLAQTITNEDAKVAEVARHNETSLQILETAQKTLEAQAGGTNLEEASKLEGEAYKNLDAVIKKLIPEYQKLKKERELLANQVLSDLVKIQQEKDQRKELLSIDFQGKIAAEAKAYKDLGRELDTSLQKQRDKLDLEYRMADMTEVQRAGLQAQLAYEESSAQAIAKRTEALQGLIDTQSALADLIEGKVQNGFTLQDDGLKELIAKYGAASEAVKKYTVLLQEMKDKASNGASLAQHIAEVGQARKETIKLRDDLAKALTDAAMKGGQGFKNTWLSIRDWLKSTFAKTVLEPQLKLFFGQMLGTNAAGSAAGSAGGSAGGSAVGSLLGSSTGSIGTILFGSPAAYGAAIGTTSVGAGSQAAMLAAQTADFGWAGVAATAEAAGSAAGTLISALSNAVPYAAAVTAVASLFNKKSTPHVGGYASADETGKTTLVTKESAGAGDYMYQIMKDIQPETQTAVESLAKSFSTVLNNTAKTFKLGGAYQVSSAFAADNDDNSRGLLKILKNATQVGTVKGNFNSDPTKGLTEYTAASVKEVKRLLSEMDLPAWAKKQLDGLSDSASLSDLATMSDNIDTIQLAFYDLQKTLAPMEGSLGELSTASSDTLYNLSVLAGGFGNLSAILSTYYKNYYSQEEQHKAGMSSLATEYAKLNVGALPQTKEAFRGVIDSFVAGGGRLKEGGEQTYLTMMQLANTFSDLNSGAVDLTKQHELEIAILRAQGNELGAVAIERQLELEALQKTNPELVTLQKALYDLADAADFATKLESAKAGLDGVAGKFLAGPDLYGYKASRIQDTLKTGGVNVDTDQILGATRDDIAALWKSVGLEGKIAITEAYQAWEDLQTLVQQTKMDDFLRGLNTTGDELMGAYDKINPKAKNLVQAWEDTTTKIDDLRSSLNSLLDLHMGETPLETALRKLKDLITRRDDLQGVVKGNEDTIYGLKSSQVSQKGVDYLKNLEKNLWASYKASDGDPKIAAQLTRVTLDRIKLEGQVKDAAASDAAKLNEKNVQAQKDALQAQIDGYKKLKDMAKELQTYILSLKAGDLSNQSYAGRLNTSKGIFDTSIKGAMSGDATALGAVQGNAQDYLKQAQQFYGGSTKEYSDIFNAVTSSLESVIGAGAGADPMLAAAQAQLDALNNLGTTTTDTSDAQIAALEELNATFGVDVASMSASIDAQSKVLKDQLTALENLATQQAAIITQAGEAYAAMVTDLDEIAADLRGTRRTAELEAASV